MPVLQYLTTTHFDFGAVKLLASELARLGVKRPMIATDKGVVAAGLIDRVLAPMAPRPDWPVFDETPGNPTEAATLQALALYRAQGCDGVVCVGGGSSMDLGKAVALLAASGLPLAQFDPQKGGAKNIKGVAPVIAIPTTAGTGSEVSVGFVIVMNSGQKMTFANPLIIPKIAICDPELTLGLPPLLTAATGMDAMTHCIEAVLTPTVNPPAEGVGYDGLWRSWKWIRQAVQNPQDRDARWHMMMASTEGAMAFVKGLGAVHAMSHAAGRLPELRLHHGTLNAVILPTVLRYHEGHAVEKYERLRSAMGLSAGADLALAIEGLNAEIGLPNGLRAMGLTDQHLSDLIPYALGDLANFGNPRKAGADDYLALFKAAM